MKKCILLIVFICINFAFAEAQEDNDSTFFELSLENLMEMEITTASKYAEPISQTPATVYVITRNDLVSRGYTSLYEVLNDIPGFDIAASQGNLSQLAYARGNRTGSYNERSMLMLDGVEANILYAQNMNISSDFPLTSIERIEIIYGPASAVYGPNVFSGIINIITKTAANLESGTSKVYIQSGLGENNTQFAELTYLAHYEAVELLLTYRRYKSNLFDLTDRAGYFSKEMFGNSKLWGPYAEYYDEYENKSNDNALFARIKIKNFEINYNHLLTKHGNGSEYPYDKTLPISHWQFKRDIFSLRYHKNLSDKLTYLFLATYQSSGSLPDNVWAQGWNASNDCNSERTVEMLTWKYLSTKWSIFQDFEYQATDKWRLNGGIKFSSAELQKSYEFGRSSKTIWLPNEQWTEPTILFPEPITTSPIKGNTFTDTEVGGFIQSKLLFLEEKLSLVTGIRFDKNEIYGNIVSPRLGLTYTPSDYLGIKTSYGTGFQSPAPRNLYGGWGGLLVNSDLKPDKIQAIDLSFTSRISDFGAEITIFNNKITNSIMQGENLPEKNIYGFEYKMNYILNTKGAVLNHVKFHFNYSYVNAIYNKIRTNLTSNRTSNKVGDIAPHKFNFILDTELFNHLSFNVRMNYVSKRPTVISNPIEKIDAFFVTNLSFQLINLFDNKLRIFFNVTNLFDLDYYHPGIDAANAGENLTVPSTGWYSSRLPQAGRNFIGGVYLTL